MSHYAAATDYLRRRSVSADAHAVGMAILAVADRVGALTDAVEALTAAHLAQPGPAVVCPGCSTVHRDSWRLCNTCAGARPA